LLPWPYLIQRAQHESRQQRDGNVVVMIQDPGEHPGKGNNADHTTGGENDDDREVDLRERADKKLVLADEQQDKCAVNSGQDHRAYGQRTANENKPQAFGTLRGRQHRDHIRDHNTYYTDDDRGYIPAPDRAQDQRGGYEDKAEEKRPYPDGIMLKKV